MPQANPTNGANSERLENVTFPQARIDINDNLEALQTLNSGNSGPSTTTAHMPWLNTGVDPAVLNIRNDTDNGWVEIGSVSSTLFKPLGVTDIANGGTGATTASAGIAALLPDQSGNSDKVLKTDGSALSWGSAGLVKGVIAFNGTNASVFKNEKLTVSRTGTGAYTITIDASIRNGTNYGVVIGAIDESALYGAGDAATGNDNSLKTDNWRRIMVTSRSTNSFTLSAYKFYQQIHSMSSDDFDLGAFYYRQAVDPDYISLAFFS